MNFTILIFCNCEGSSSWVWQQSQNTQARGPQIEQIKGCLGGGLRCLECFYLRVDLNAMEIVPNELRFPDILDAQVDAVPSNRFYKASL